MAGLPPFKCDINDIKKVIIEENGNIMAVSEHYGVARFTIYRFIEAHPELQEVVDKAREKGPKDLLDMAIFVSVHNLLNYKDNPSLAQQVAKQIFDREEARSAMQNGTTLNVNLPCWAKPKADE